MVLDRRQIFRGTYRKCVDIIMFVHTWSKVFA